MPPGVNGDVGEIILILWCADLDCIEKRKMQLDFSFLGMGWTAPGCLDVVALLLGWTARELFHSFLGMGWTAPGCLDIAALILGWTAPELFHWVGLESPMSDFHCKRHFWLHTFSLRRLHGRKGPQAKEDFSFRCAWARSQPIMASPDAEICTGKT